MIEKKLDFSSLQKAITSLQEGLAIVADNNWFDQQTAQVQRTLVAGVVQNFEFVYELSIKMLRRQLALEADSPEEIDHTSFRHLLRTAAEKGFIDNVEAWFKYRELRNITFYAYDREKARLVYQQSVVFIDDADVLYQALEARNGAS